MTPQFDANGNLPPGVHRWSWPDFEAAFSWTPQRKVLMDGLKRALLALKVAGCLEVYIDGSFITEKDDPSDYDGCWEAAGVDLSMLDRILLTFDPGRVAQKTKYGGEMFLAHAIAERRIGQRFLEFFQQDRDGRAKGIVALELGSVA